MTWRAQWPMLRRVLVIGFLIAAAGLLWRYAQVIQWHEVGAAIADYPSSQLALAAAMVPLAYACYCSFDVLARTYTGHDLSLRRVLGIAFVSYAFNLNLGATIGGIGFRYRLYSQAGLRVATISRVIAFAIAGNWSGFLLLGGLSFTFNQVPLPPEWEIAAHAQRIAGLVMLAAVTAWLAMCMLSMGKSSRKRRWSLRGHDIELPSPPAALLLLALASASWLAIAAIVHVLMPDGVGYLTVAGVLLLSVLANLVIRIPANAGVMEVVFVAVLAPQLQASQVLAALLTYRALFHIAPLLLALGVYAVSEARRRRS